MAKKLTTEQFLERIKVRFPDMFNENDYNETVYVNIATKVSVRCKKHGLFQVWPGDHMSGMFGCKICIQNKRKETNIKKIWR